MMKTDLSQPERELFVTAVPNRCCPSKLSWETTSAMAEQLECEELEEVVDLAQAFSITADTGIVLDFDDLDDLGVGPPRVRIGRPLPDYR
jgi:hypothetical protein